MHCAVPLLDMVRFHRFLIARLWIPEYGDPDEPEDFAWLHAYSPYHRVVDGTCYPAVLLTTAEQDTRVDPFHARKFAARLQEATSCGDEHPVLLRVESRAGHGVGKPVVEAGRRGRRRAAFLDAVEPALTTSGTWYSAPASEIPPVRRRTGGPRAATFRVLTGPARRPREDVQPGREVPARGRDTASARRAAAARARRRRSCPRA